MTERDFFQQIWRAYDTVTFDGNIKAQVVNVCFPTRSVCVSLPNKIREWVNCERIDKHTTRPNEPSNEDQVVENMFKELSGADEKMHRQSEEIERLKATIEKLKDTNEIRLANLLSETKRGIAILNEGLTIKKSKLEQVENGLQTIESICDSLSNIYNEVSNKENDTL